MIEGTPLIGPYRIVKPLGSGGMGDVFLASDTRLARQVAIKILPEEFAGNAERLGRFRREARAAAALTHPNIAAIFDIGEALPLYGETEPAAGAAPKVHFMVQELVTGKTLREVITGGPLPLTTAVRLGAEMAGALVAAHGAGIVHRDLKPSNVFVTDDEHAKIVDFGLAKLIESSTLSDPRQSAAPTSLATSKGQIMGTVGYMAPEQIEGLPADGRADLFALGCILYEIVCGARPFRGKNIHDTLARVLSSEPDLPEVHGVALPPELRRILHKCLAKQPARRYQGAADLEVDLRDLEASIEDTSSAAELAWSQPQDTDRSRWRRILGWGLATLATGAVIVFAILKLSGTAAPAPPTHSTLEVIAGQRLWSGPVRADTPEERQRPRGKTLSLSPDGRQLVYSATDGETPQLYLRALDTAAARAIDHTEGGHDPFFSPDGASIAFFTPASYDGTPGRLMRVATGSGAPRVVGEATGFTPYGASWSDHGKIALSDGRRLWSVDANGGELTLLAEPDPDAGETRYLTPRWLPGSRALLFAARHGLDWSKAHLMARRVDTGEQTSLVVGGSDPRYLAPEHLLFARNGTLMAIRFDPQTLRVSGQPIRVIEDIMHSINRSNSMNTGIAQFDVSASGTLVYATGGVHPLNKRTIARVTTGGEAMDLPIQASDIYHPRISPDGERIAYLLNGYDHSDIWVYDLRRQVPTRLTLGGGQACCPVWMPDGRSIVFSSDRDGAATNLYRVAADDPEQIQRLTVDEMDQFPSSASPAGEVAFVQDRPDAKGRDLWILTAAGTARPFMESEATKESPVFSPDGRRIAYTARQIDTKQVYIRPYPGPGAALRVSADGGMTPLWSANGERLYFRWYDADFFMTRMYAVDLDSGPALRAGPPRLLFDHRYVGTVPVRSYDITADGDFVMVTRPSVAPQPVTRLHLVLNWLTELDQLLAGNGG